MLFYIAEHTVRITFSDGTDVLEMLPSFKAFRVEDDGKDALLEITVDNTLRSESKKNLRLIRDVDTGNGMTKVFRLEHHEEDGKVVPYGYQYIISDIAGNNCALLITDEDFRHCRCALVGNIAMKSYGLNSCLMLSYAFCVASFDTVLIHASLVRKEGRGYAFTAKSGTGKSTQVSNWMRYIPGCDLMNDDNPIVRVIDGKAFIYGSPWSGKTPCYRKVKAEFGGVAQIKRAPENKIQRLNTIDSFVTLLPACSTMKWDERVFLCNSQTVSKILETVPVYNLFCLPDRESAVVASEGMTKK